MEIFLFIVLIVVVVLFFNKISSKQDEVLKSITQLRREIDDLKASGWEKPSKDKDRVETPIVSPIEKKIEIPLPPITPIVEERQEVIPATPLKETPEPVLNIEEKPFPAEAKPQATYIPLKTIKSTKTIKPPKPSFWERNPDLEKFIGENLINKIGIAILVLGIGFFVKYAIDKEWINEYGRVGIGFLAGGILVAIAHKLRKTFAAFSSVLIGGGMAVMYFTITIAFHDYHIFGQTAAFILMVIVTGFSIFLSYVYNRVELAVLAIVGGFTAPFLVSTGEGNYAVLFTYLIILNTGMLVLAYFKKWNLVNIVSYVFTVILYSSWLGTKVVGVKDAPYGGALFFATIFYLIFFVMNIINNVKEKRKFNGLEIALLLSNTFLYFSAGMLTLSNIDGGVYRGLFTVLIAVFNFLFVLFLFKKSETDKNLIYLLIGLVLTFISLAAPIQLEGNYITLFWAIESVLLLWLAQKSGIELLKLSGVAIISLMLISLVMDWGNIYGNSDSNLMIIINKGFITGVCCIGALVGNLILINREQGKFFLYDVEKSIYKIILSGILSLVTYIFLLLEVSHQANVYTENGPLIYLIIGFYNYLFLITVDVLVLKGKSMTLKKVGAGISTIGVLGYLFFYQIEISSLRNDYLDFKIGLLALLFHYCVIAAMIVMVFLLFKLVKELFKEGTNFRRAFIYIFSFLVIFTTSAELVNFILMLGERSNLHQEDSLSSIRKIGFPILWGVCSFAFMYLGMKRKVKDLRIISLSLFGITLVKLFIFDLRGLSEGGKIASFIILGVILLIISFMYQKVKALIVEESPIIEQKSDDKEE